MTLFLTGPDPRFEYEIELKYPPNSSAAYVAPIGLDGLFRKGSPTLAGVNPGHIPARKGMWLNGQTFEVDAEDLGQGRKTRYRFSFDGAKLNFHLTADPTPSHLNPNAPRASRCGDDHVANDGRSGLTIPEAPTLRARGTAT